MKSYIKISCLISLIVSFSYFSGCTSNERHPLDKGYDLGRSDTVKSHYWMLTDLQKQKEAINNVPKEKYRTIEVPVYGKNQDGTEIADHYVSVKVIDRQ